MTADAPPAAKPSILAGGLRLPTIGVVLVITVLAFEYMAIAAAMPVAARELNGVRLYAWAFSAVFIAGLLGNVVAGGWSDARGPARPLFTGLSVFIVGLLVAGTAPSMGPFVAGRAIQGFGAGLTAVPVYVVIARVYPAEVRPKMFAATAGAWVLPSLVGPYAGGLIAEHLGWRWVFLGLVPMVVPGGLMLVPVLRGTATRGAMPRGRSLAAVALAAGAGVLLWGIDNRSWFGLAGPPLLAYGLRVLLPRGTMRLARGLPSSIATRGLLLGAMTATEVFIPLALTTRYGFSPSLAGIVLTAGALGWSAGSWWQGRYPPESGGRFIVIGAALLALGVLAVEAALHISGWLSLPSWIIAGLGMGLAYPAISVRVLNLTDPADQGTNSAGLQISDSLGSSLATGLSGAIVNAAGLGAAGLCAIAVAAVAALAGHRVEDRRA
jgi:MFS family permease